MLPEFYVDCLRIAHKANGRALTLVPVTIEGEPHLYRIAIPVNGSVTADNVEKVAAMACICARDRWARHEASA